MKNKSQAIRTIAVSNFLCSMHGLSYHEAVGNCELDAALYGWNDATCRAIMEGIHKHFSTGANEGLQRVMR